MTPLKLTQAVAVALFLCGASYSVGRVHADLDTHASTEGHPALVEKVQSLAVTQAKVVAVLERLEKRR